MYWINVNEKYLDYLRQVDNRIPYTNYGQGKYKPFFGVLFETDDFCYVTQISHPQPQHQKLKQTRDFYKIYDTVKDASRLIGVIHLNYMFPIPRSEFEVFQMSKIREYRSFKSETEKSKYIDLLRREIREINKLPLEKNAKLIYENKYKYPNDWISKRALDFKNLEVYARKWIIAES